jgi:hypothetical protein
MPKILFYMFKEAKRICKFMDEFHTDYSFQKELCNKVARVRSLHHDNDFSVAYGGCSDRRRHLNSAKTQRQLVSVGDFINSV